MSPPPVEAVSEEQAANHTLAEAVEQARKQATANITTADILEAIDECGSGC